MNQAETAATIKKLFLPAVLFLVVLVAGIWWFYLREPFADQAFGKINEPKIQSILVSSTKIGNLVNIGKATKPPKVAGVFEKTPALSEEEIAKQLGFGGEPETISGQKVWTEGDKSLRFTADGSDLSFTNLTEMKTGNLKEEEAISQAENLLRSLGILSLTKGKSELIISPVSHLRVEKTEANQVQAGEQFNIYSISFGLKIGSFSLVNQSGVDQLINVWIGRDGTLKKIEGTTQPLITESSSTYKIKSLKAAEQELADGKGTIVATSGPINYSGSIRVWYTRAEFSYFQGFKAEKYFQPVFVFHGVTDGSEGKVEVTTVLPALQF